MERGERKVLAHYDAFIPSKNGQFVEPSNKVPSSSDVASYEYRKSEYRKGVHVDAGSYCRLWGRIS